MKKNARRLRQALTDNHELAKRFDQPGFPLDELELLQDWQRKRLAETYKNLIIQDRYCAAAEFFLTELYGGLHFRARDQEVKRVLPIIVRMLRDDMLLALAEAFELQSLSMELDIEMTLILQKTGWNELNTNRYGEIYRTCARRTDREKQVDIIRNLGHDLNKLVRHRIVLWIIKSVRRPAHAAGFGLLQTFLEQGFKAFRIMGDGTEFIETIWNKESEILRRLMEGDKNPF